ncbi:hypothetical protein [Chitinophaga rhizophila]|uniref:Sensor of ECF-type sigma factor n=1 Tax=Chitinophaga rhizophila TaxID=2866212 RepID=A0ABS7GD70_9BACT|nr:hypothetical protein [Chitinophaga rhizophila]MBW8685616.1 hypothetical protein [Chitinophaga rhizophila]
MKHFYTLSIFIVLTLFCRPPASRAQQGSDDQMKDRIRAAEIAYLSQKLDLTPDEAQKFWPLYNKYTKEVEILIAERRKHNAGQKTANQPTDQKELGYERRMLDIKTHYSQEFQKVLPAAKAGNVFRSEREFRHELIRAMKDRQSRNVNGPGARRFRQ